MCFNRIRQLRGREEAVDQAPCTITTFHTGTGLFHVPSTHPRQTSHICWDIARAGCDLTLGKRASVSKHSLYRYYSLGHTSPYLPGVQYALSIDQRCHHRRKTTGLTVLAESNGGDVPATSAGTRKVISVHLEIRFELIDVCVALCSAM